ncbi:MAG: N-acetylmuramoyl-L-alanine amidase [Caulobacteraceae bacterium]
MRPPKPIAAASPNFDARLAPPDMVVLHYTGMKSGAAALARLTDPAAKVSAHYMIEEDGRLFCLVAEERRAWHAGKASWRGETDINAVSIGIELVNPGHEFGYRPFPAPQIEALIGLMDDIRSRWSIEHDRILGHSDVAPARKADPGELFPWKALAVAGHGLWAEAPAAPGAALREGDEGPAVFVLRAGLGRLGYDLSPAERYDGACALTVRAFPRHWVPGRIDGVADGATRARLVALLRLMEARHGP